MVDEHFNLSVTAREEIRAGRFSLGLGYMAQAIDYSRVGSTERKRAERAVEGVLTRPNASRFVVDAMLALTSINKHLNSEINDAISSNDRAVISQYAERAVPFLVNKILYDRLYSVKAQVLLVNCALFFPATYLSALAAIDSKGDTKLQALKGAATTASEKLTQHLIKVSEAMAHFDVIGHSD